MQHIFTILYHANSLVFLEAILLSSLPPSLTPTSFPPLPIRVEQKIIGQLEDAAQRYTAIDGPMSIRAVDVALLIGDLLRCVNR